MNYVYIKILCIISDKVQCETDTHISASVLCCWLLSRQSGPAVFVVFKHYFYILMMAMKNRADEGL